MVNPMPKVSNFEGSPNSGSLGIAHDWGTNTLYPFIGASAGGQCMLQGLFAPSLQARRLSLGLERLEVLELFP